MSLGPQTPSNAGLTPGGPRRMSSVDSELSRQGAYRPVATLAVVSLIGGLASFLAFLHPYFWVLPPVALLIAARTSQQLEKARLEYAGQLLAKIAILLALIAGIGSVTRYLTTWLLLTREARAMANSFLDEVLVGEYKQAFVLTRPPLERAGLEGQPDQVIMRSGEHYRNFLTEPLITTFAGKLADTQVTYVEVKGYGEAGGYHTAQVVYRLTLDTPQKPAAPPAEDDGIPSATADRQVYEVTIYLKGATAQNAEWEGRQWFVSGSPLRLAGSPNDPSIEETPDPAAVDANADSKETNNETDIKGDIKSDPKVDNEVKTP